MTGLLCLRSEILIHECWKCVVDLQVCEHTWGEDTAALGPQPDIILGADVVYQQEHFDALASSILALSAPHTLTFLSYRLRGEMVGRVCHTVSQGMHGHIPVQRCCIKWRSICSLPEAEMCLPPLHNQGQVA